MYLQANLTLLMLQSLHELHTQGLRFTAVSAAELTLLQNLEAEDALADSSPDSRLQQNC